MSTAGLQGEGETKLGSGALHSNKVHTSWQDKPFQDQRCPRCFHKRDAQIRNAAYGRNALAPEAGHPPPPACQLDIKKNAWGGRRERRVGEIGRLERVQGKEVSGVTSFRQFLRTHGLRLHAGSLKLLESNQHDCNMLKVQMPNTVRKCVKCSFQSRA